MQIAQQTVSAAEALKEKIASKTARVGIVGLGYVGLPLAVEFGRAGFSVTGIDVQAAKVDQMNRGDFLYPGRAGVPLHAAGGRQESSRPPRTSPSSANWTRSTSASRRRCARPRTRT